MDLVVLVNKMTDDEIIERVRTWLQKIPDKADSPDIFNMLTKLPMTYNDCIKEMENKTEIGIELLQIWKLGFETMDRVRKEKLSL